jgi:hypothetical protein
MSGEAGVSMKTGMKNKTLAGKEGGNSMLAAHEERANVLNGPLGRWEHEIVQEEVALMVRGDSEKEERRETTGKKRCSFPLGALQLSESCRVGTEDAAANDLAEPSATGTTMANQRSELRRILEDVAERLVTNSDMPNTHSELQAVFGEAWQEEFLELRTWHANGYSKGAIVIELSRRLKRAWRAKRAMGSDDTTGGLGANEAWQASDVEGREHEQKPFNSTTGLPANEASQKQRNSNGGLTANEASQKRGVDQTRHEQNLPSSPGGLRANEASKNRDADLAMRGSPWREELDQIVQELEKQQQIVSAAERGIASKGTVKLKEIAETVSRRQPRHTNRRDAPAVVQPAE